MYIHVPKNAVRSILLSITQQEYSHTLSLNLPHELEQQIEISMLQQQIPFTTCDAILLLPLLNSF